MRLVGPPAAYAQNRVNRDYVRYNFVAMLCTQSCPGGWYGLRHCPRVARRPCRAPLRQRAQTLHPVVSRELIAEYRDVLCRARFGFRPAQVSSLLDDLAALALCLNARQIDSGVLPDPDDAPFIAVALAAACPIVTGNVRHFPVERGVEVLTPVQCLARLYGER